MGKKYISFSPISRTNIILAKKYAMLMGYKCHIDNDKRIAVITDPNQNVGLLTEVDGVLNYFHKGHYEPILWEDVEFVKRMPQSFPKSILRAIWGIAHLNKRAEIKKLNYHD